MSMFGMTKDTGNNNFGNTGNMESSQVNLGVSQIEQEGTMSGTTGGKKTILSRIGKRKQEITKEEETLLIQKNIDNSLKVNMNDMINPLEMNIKNSLFFRLHVTGVIESANVI